MRAVKLGGKLGRGDVTRHLEFAGALGFNGIWLASHQAGRWTVEAAPDGPALSPEFELAAASWARQRTRLLVALDPWVDSAGTFTFHRADAAQRIVEFALLLRRRAAVRDLVLSLREAPRRLSDLRDIDRFGVDAAAAHLDLARRVAAG
ncbi:MAG TPA: hypothetical protein VJS92_15155, partial [Candidatus Polarisedimenticolaceae bacterium]|nr:hypothetical protein [Candidatus Polarisedimenticolaceae bacterium]